MINEANPYNGTSPYIDTHRANPSSMGTAGETESKKVEDDLSINETTNRQTNSLSPTQNNLTYYIPKFLNPITARISSSSNTFFQALKSPFAHKDQSMEFKPTLQSNTPQRLTNASDTPPMRIAGKTESGEGKDDLLANQITNRQTDSLSISFAQNLDQIASLAESSLVRTSISHLSSNQDLTSRFSHCMRLLKETQDSNKYSSILKESEEILLQLEANSSSDSKDEIDRMKVEFSGAFQRLPEGTGLLTQLEVDYLKRRTLVPQKVICRNHLGEEFSKPSISINSLVSHFLQLGYSKVMHSREVLDFEGRQEVCDVFMIGEKRNYSFSSLFYNKNLENEIKILDVHFQENKKAIELGYQNSESKLIKNLKDAEKAKHLIEQGFQICTILIYPKVIKNTN